MSELINDGGPAFPQRVVVAQHRDQHGNIYHETVDFKLGMSLRDYFAGQALNESLRRSLDGAQVLMADAGVTLDDLTDGSEEDQETLAEAMRAVIARAAKDAYKLADAMLEARQEPRPRREE